MPIHKQYYLGVGCWGVGFMKGAYTIYTNPGRRYNNTACVPIVWNILTLKVLVATIDAQWEGMGDVGSARYEPALLPPCPTIKVLSYSN